jgi:multidrug efflux pump subunit AcrA (membrane-fusion protein)
MKGVTIIGAFFATFAVAATVVVWPHLVQTSPSMARKAKAPMPVQVAQAKYVDLTEVVGATGQVQPIALVNITVKTPERVETLARVEKVLVDIGTRVSPGQPLIQLERGQLHAALTTAQAAMEQKTGDLERSQEHFRRIKTIYEQGLLAKIDLEKAQAAIEQAKTEYAKSKEELLRARKDLQNATIVSPVLGIVMERLINPAKRHNPIRSSSPLDGSTKSSSRRR